jgi:hypothetical protein
MKQIDRLLLKVTGRHKWTMMAFVDDLGDGTWEASYSFWDGKPGSGGQYPGSSRHTSSDEAVGAVELAMNEFPHPLAWSNIIIDDYGPDTGGGEP